MIYTCTNLFTISIGIHFWNSIFNHFKDIDGTFNDHSSLI